MRFIIDAQLPLSLSIFLKAIFDQHLEKISYLMEVNSLIEITRTEIVVHGR